MAFKHYKQFILGAVVSLLFFSACNRNTDLEHILYKETKNKIYKKLDEEKLSTILQASLNKKNKNLKNAKFIAAYYKEKGYSAVLIKKFFPKEKLNILAEELTNASNHGLKKEYFKADEYKNLLSTVSSKDKINTIEDAYQQIANLEIATADALLNYSAALQFGVVNPNKVLSRYYIETKQADSSFMQNILGATDIETLLDSIQPKSNTYLALQKALKSDLTIENKSQEEVLKTIMVNMERARWKQDIDTSKMVYVNIPAFQLDVYEDGKSVMNMKVVVGTGRNNSGESTFTENKSIKDIPNSHETPVLSSRIHSVQVNPVWNIPKSIAGNEMLKHVQADRFYLANAGIDVLQDGKVIEDSENIDWSAFSPSNLPYRFRQRPGDENALGKIKFLFKNNSSVYLHDTPAQSVFSRNVRASSHGCVRVAEPLDLAKALFGNGDKFTTIKNDMEAENQKEAKDITLSPKTQVVLDYRTIELKDGKLNFYSDVYGHDIVLYSYF